MYLIETKIQVAEFNRAKRNSEYYFDEENKYLNIVTQVRT